LALRTRIVLRLAEGHSSLVVARPEISGSGVAEIATNEARFQSTRKGSVR
jgi:hypothetical protein